MSNTVTLAFCFIIASVGVVHAEQPSEPVRQPSHGAWSTVCFRKPKWDCASGQAVEANQDHLVRVDASFGFDQAGRLQFLVRWPLALDNGIALLVDGYSKANIVKPECTENGCEVEIGIAGIKQIGLLSGHTLTVLMYGIMQSLDIDLTDLNGALDETLRAQKRTRSSVGL